MCPVPENLPDRERWKNLQAIGLTVNHTTQVRTGKQTSEVRVYILDKTVSGKKFGELVRSHWGIENRLHWQLDVTFGEDQCRVRKQNGDRNLSTVRRTALSLLKRDLLAKCGVKNRRLTAAWDEDYLQQVVFGM